MRDLRRLLYCGEWIESHALHIYLLHAPDFLGFDGVVDMAPHAPEAVERGLRLKRAGNEIMTLVGGRSIHPVNVRLGGFYRVPSRAELRTLREPLLRAREDAFETVRWVSGFDFPDFEQPQEYLALRSPDRYAIEGGSFVSSSGITFDAGGLRPARARGARRAVERPARPAARGRQLRRRADGPLRGQP